MGKKKRKQQEAKKQEPGFEINPFASLKVDLAAAASVNPAPPEPETQPQPSAQDDDASFEELFDGRADSSGWSKTFLRQVLKIHLEKKGRGGKSVTVLSGFDLDMEAEVQVLVSKLKKGLGTGGTVKFDQLEIQGDKRTQVAQWLTDQGFRVRGDIPR